MSTYEMYIFTDVMIANGDFETATRKIIVKGVNENIMRMMENILQEICPTSIIIKLSALDIEDL